MRLASLFALCVSFASAVIAQSVTYEAEDGVLSGTEKLTEVTGFSGSGYVGGFDEAADSVSITVTSASQKLYDLKIRYSAPYGSKYTRMTVNGGAGGSGEIYFPEGTTWETANAGQILLSAGENVIKFENNWGW